MVMFREKLDAQLGNFFYQISGIGDDISAEERLAMQESITGVWEYFTKSADKDCTDNDVSIKLSFQTEGRKSDTENHLKSFEKFYTSNKSLFTPAIIVNIMRTGEAIAQSYYDTNEVDTDVINQLEKMFFK